MPGLTEEKSSLSKQPLSASPRNTHSLTNNNHPQPPTQQRRQKATKQQTRATEEKTAHPPSRLNTPSKASRGRPRQNKYPRVETNPRKKRKRKRTITGEGKGEWETLLYLTCVPLATQHNTESRSQYIIHPGSDVIIQIHPY